MKMFTVSKTEAQKVLAEIERSWPWKPPQVRLKGVRVAEIDEYRNIFIFSDIVVCRLKDELFPHLVCEDLLKRFPRVVVDSGAVPYLCRGADVMRPGIKHFEGAFEVGCIVAVQEVRHKKFISIGRSLLGRIEAEALSSGAVVKNLHYVGDKLWEAYKNLKL